MKIDGAGWQRLFRGLMTVLLTFCVVWGFNEYFGLKINVFFIVLAAILTHMIMVYLDKNKKSGVLWLSIGAVLFVIWAVTGIIFKSPSMFFTKIADRVSDIVAWLGEYAELRFDPYALSEDAQNYRLSYVIAIASALIFSSGVLIYMLCHNIISRLTLAGIFTAALVTLVFIGVDMNKLSLMCVLLFIALTAAELVNLQLGKKRGEPKQNASFFLLPMCLLLSLFVIAFPSKPEPIDWHSVTDAYYRVVRSFNSTIDYIRVTFGNYPESFTVNFTGIASTGGSNITDDARRALLKVSTNTFTKSRIYLRGTVYDTYTGSGWRDNSDGVFSSREPAIETYEAIYAMIRTGLTPDEGESIFRKTSIDIEFGALSTRFMLYTPLYPHIAISIPSYEDEIKVEGPNIRFKRVQHGGYTYKLEYSETNWGSENFIGFLKTLDGFRYAHDTTEFGPLGGNRGSAVWEIFGGNFLYDGEIWNDQIGSLLARRAENIRDLYLKVPDTVSSRVRELAREITAGCETDYDKIIAIEDYFSDWTYKLSPERTPKNVDFVDWFLFEGTEGYCTYYATAATILARCAGLPARYVEGAYVKDQVYKGEPYEADIRGLHAWSEVYLEGYGWITMDATPGFSVGREREWARQTVSTAAPETDAVQPDIEGEIGPPGDQKLENWIPDTQGAIDTSMPERQNPFIWTVSSIALGVTIIIIAVCMTVAKVRNRNRRYEKANANEKIRLSMLEALKYIAIEGKKIGISETLSEFSDRIGERYNFHEMSFKSAVSIYLKSRFSDTQMTRYEVLSIYRYCRELRAAVSKRIGFMNRVIVRLR